MVKSYDSDGGFLTKYPKLPLRMLPEEKYFIDEAKPRTKIYNESSSVTAKSFRSEQKLKQVHLERVENYPKPTDLLDAIVKWIDVEMSKGVVFPEELTGLVKASMKVKTDIPIK